jgi:hypothetical protein
MRKPQSTQTLEKITRLLTTLTDQDLHHAITVGQTLMRLRMTAKNQMLKPEFIIKKEQSEEITHEQGPQDTKWTIENKEEPDVQQDSSS